MKTLYNLCTSTYRFILSLLYQEKKITKLDSRTIQPPRLGNITERNLCSQIDVASTEYITYYSNPYVHACIYWHKYKRDIYTTRLLARLLWDEIISQISNTLDNRSALHNWIITPAPSNSYHCGEKSWDHNDDITRAMNVIPKQSQKVKIYIQNIFEISADLKNVANKKLGRTERFKNSKNKFNISSPYALKQIMTSPFGLVIIDDVTTTGSTLLNLKETSRILNPTIILTISIAH
ncbi:MAG: hypothetical protein WCG97_03000 [bacterium]